MRLYAIRYASNFKYGTYGSVYRDAENPNEAIEEFAFLYYLAEYNGKYTLIDTGFRDEKLALDMGVTLLDVEKEIISVFGKVPQINKVILTHNHWDHVNNLDLYRDISVVMARATYQSIMQEGEEAVKNTLQSDSIILVDKDMLIDDIFHFQVIGGHTPDSSVLCFVVDDKRYVLTGDECYLCANIIENRPIGICSDMQKNEDFIAKMHREGWIPLPFHDKEIMNKYRSLSANIAQIL